MKPSQLFDIPRPADFEEFWKLYPKGRKQNRPTAERAWAKMTPQERQMAIDDLKERVGLDPRWEERCFIPHPGSYLNGKRWEDDWREGLDQKPKEHLWKLSDRELVKRCQEAGIRTEGKSRDELITRLGDKQ